MMNFSCEIHYTYTQPGPENFSLENLGWLEIIPKPPKLFERDRKGEPMNSWLHIVGNGHDFIKADWE